jgi:SAM-dependent methyltransferase
MHDHVRFSEDLPLLAVEAFELAGRFCGACKNFHMLWPYLRLAGASGRDVEAPLIHSVLSDLLSRSGQNVLIAGAADTGLLALVARAGGSGAAVTVLDRCETPLGLCRRFARRWSLPIEIVHLDLMEFAKQSSFGVVFAHMLLQFIPACRHLDVLSRIRRSLRSEGRLVLAFRTSSRIEGDLAVTYRRDYPSQLIKQLEGKNIGLPEPREAFRHRVEVYAEERRAREGAHTSREEVEQLIHAAGFKIELITPFDANVSAPFSQLAAQIGKRRYLTIAAPA